MRRGRFPVFRGAIDGMKDRLLEATQNSEKGKKCQGMTSVVPYAQQN